MQRWLDNAQDGWRSIRRLGARISAIVTTVAVVALVVLLAPLIGALLAVVLAAALWMLLFGVIWALIVSRRLMKEFRQARDQMSGGPPQPRPSRRVDSRKIDAGDTPPGA